MWSSLTKEWDNKLKKKLSNDSSLRILGIVKEKWLPKKEHSKLKEQNWALNTNYCHDLFEVAGKIEGLKKSELRLYPATTAKETIDYILLALSKA
jgi:hypothetical protein